MQCIMSLNVLLSNTRSLSRTYISIPLQLCLYLNCIVSHGNTWSQSYVKMRLTRVLTQTPAMSFTNLQRSGSSLFTTPGWRGGLVVGRRTCDLVVAGSRPGRDAATYNLRQVVHTLLPLSPSSIIGYQRKLGSKQAYLQCSLPSHWTFFDAA